MAELEEDIIKESEYKPYLWWRDIDGTFLLWKHGENKLKPFTGKINKVHSTIKFTAERSKISINFLDVTVSLKEGIAETDFYVKTTDSCSIYNLAPATLPIVKRVYHIIRL